MKKLPILALMLLSIASYAQQSESLPGYKDTTIAIKKVDPTVMSYAKRSKYTQNNEDTTLVIKKRNIEITYKGQEATKIWKSASKFKKWKWDQGRFMGGNIMYNGLVENLRTMQLPDDASQMSLMTKSIGVDINLIDAVLYSRGCFGVVMGLGIESNNFRFNNNVSLTKDSEGNTVIDNSFTERGIHLSKSKLTTTYLNVPIMLQLHFKPGGYVSLGVVTGIRLQSYTKTVSPELGKQKVFSDFNLRNIHYGFVASVGYGGVSLTAKYYPNSIFRTGQGPKVEQASVGIGFMF